MSEQASHLPQLIVIVLLISARAWLFFGKLWGQPLRYGEGFFLGFAVPPGFYVGPGIRWLKSYRTLMTAEHLVEGLALAAILASNRWAYVPVWAGGGAVLFVVTYLLFFSYSRHTLQADSPAPARVVISLASRRLGDYFSLPAEAACWMLAAASWGLLLTGLGSGIEWGVPVLTTYGALGMLPGKIACVRGGLPLPAEQTEEHQRWIEAHRHHTVRIMSVAQWFLITILAGYAGMYRWPFLGVMGWLVFGAVLGAWLAVILSTLRAGTRLQEMSRCLRSPAGWAEPFRFGRSWMSGGLLTGLYLAGLITLIVLFRP